MENGGPYLLPEEAELTVPLTQGLYAGMQLFTLNPDAAGTKLIVYLPGGSYIDPPRAVHWSFLNALAEDADAAVLVPIYPKLPDHDAAACLEALTAAYTAYLGETAPEELIFMGDSAGGGLALSLAMTLRDAGLPRPEQLILICPWLDVTLTNPDIPAYEKKDPAIDSEQLRQLGALWADTLDPADPRVSPLYGTFDGLGRITVLIGTGELLYPDAMVLDEALTQQGIDHDTAVWSGMFHVWPLYYGYSIPEAEEAYQYILQTVVD